MNDLYYYLLHRNHFYNDHNASDQESDDEEDYAGLYRPFCECCCDSSPDEDYDDEDEDEEWREQMEFAKLQNKVTQLRTMLQANPRMHVLEHIDELKNKIDLRYALTLEQAGNSGKQTRKTKADYLLFIDKIEEFSQKCIQNCAATLETAVAERLESSLQSIEASINKLKKEFETIPHHEQLDKYFEIDALIYAVTTKLKQSMFSNMSMLYVNEHAFTNPKLKCFQKHPIGTLVYVADAYFQDYMLRINNFELTRNDLLIQCLLDTLAKQASASKSFYQIKLMDTHRVEITGKQIDRLSNDVLEDFQALKTLSLNGNYLLKVDNGILTSLKNLKFLNLADNLIHEVDKEAFKDLPNLVELDLSNNQLDKLDKNTFQGSIGLKKLSLNNNKLTSIHTNLFNGLINLQALFLSDNKLTGLSKGVFKGLLSLEILSLNNNDLTCLDEDLFCDLKKLIELHLSSLKIPRLTKGILKNLFNLRKLDLSGNNLKTFNMNIYRHLTKLAFLNLEGNKLSQFQKNKLKIIKSLNLVNY